MSLEAFFQMIEALAVVGALIFALVQVKQYRRRQVRESAMELLHSFQTPDFAKALMLVYNMPLDLTKRQIEQHLGADMHLVYAMTTTWESIGVLVHRGELSLYLVEDFFSGPVQISWQKLKNYVIGEREEQSRETIGEWFQWLAERIGDLEQVEDPVPAHIAHRDWRPA